MTEILGIAAIVIGCLPLLAGVVFLAIDDLEAFVFAIVSAGVILGAVSLIGWGMSVIA